MMAGNSVCHSVFNVLAGLQEIVCCNHVHIHRMEIAPQEQGYLTIMCYNRLHTYIYCKTQPSGFLSCCFSTMTFPYKMSYWRHSLNHSEPPAMFCPSLGVILMFIE